MLRFEVEDSELQAIAEKLSPRAQTRAVVQGVNRALDRIEVEWGRRILARYRNRTLRLKDVRDAVVKKKMSETGSRPATLRVRREGLSLSKFIPRGTLANQERYRQRGGWKEAGRRERRRTGKKNVRTPRVRVQVLASSVERAIKGAFVWEVSAGQYQVFRIDSQGKMTKLFATSIFTQGLKVLNDLRPFAHERVQAEVARNVQRLLDRRQTGVVTR